MLKHSQGYINPSLDAISSFLTEIANPHHCFKTIHIAGTNGKGSVCSFLELLFLRYKPELKIAKYTSPHLVSVSERYRINGKEISEEEFDRIQDDLSQDPSFASLTGFERLTAIAFQCFKEREVDLAILETGLGGRWDATNVIPAENRLATAITNVSWDHMDYLGNTLAEIRAEKEAIKKDKVPHFDASDYAVGDNPNDVNGANFNLALEIFKEISGLKDLEIDAGDEIFEQFKDNYSGRLQFIAEQKLLLDGAHNPAAAKLLNKYLEKNFPSPRIFIIAMLDKDYKSFIDELFANNLFDPNLDRILLVELEHERAIAASNLYTYIKDSLNYQAEYLDLKDLKSFIQTNSEFKVVSGSLYLIAEVLN